MSLLWPEAPVRCGAAIPLPHLRGRRVRRGLDYHTTTWQSVAKIHGGNAMRRSAPDFVSGFSIALMVLAFTRSAGAVEPRFSWLLPKTVLDATFVYTYQDCTNDTLKIKISATLVPRAIPDPLVGQKKIELNDLKS